jgi:hypothetical protein
VEVQGDVAAPDDANPKASGHDGSRCVDVLGAVGAGMAIHVPVVAACRTASIAAAWSIASARPKVGAVPSVISREAFWNSTR